MQCFCIAIDTTKTALLLNVNRNTINRWYAIFRQEIYQYQLNQKTFYMAQLRSMNPILAQSVKGIIMTSSNVVVGL